VRDLHGAETQSGWAHTLQQKMRDRRVRCNGRPRVPNRSYTTAPGARAQCSSSLLTEHIMKNLLALATVAALMSACAGWSGTAGDGADGPVVAAMLGYHGRVAIGPGNDGN
jgi:hypothetical protein